MYYAAKDPIALEGEKREAPKVEFLPVTDATPQFKNIKIKNVVCDGAEKALFIRGLPEMNIHSIFLENITISANKGIECSEAKNISLKNVNIYAKDNNPLIDILNSSDIRFESFNKNISQQPVVRIGGDRSANIYWHNSKTIDMAKSVFEFGATQTVLQIK